MFTKTRYMLTALAVTTALAAVSLPASAQMFEQAYSNNNRDGLGTALVMKQVDEGLFSRSGTTTTSGTSTSEIFLCGGDGSEGSSAGATANTSCIILGDNTNAVIDLGQASDGDQNATSDTDTGGDLSDALAGLSGG
jgi:hypothetical protein